MKPVRAAVIAVILGTELFLTLSCGVKADPQPPATPSEIGHGKPLYKNEEDARPLRRAPNPEDEKNNDQDYEENQ